MNNKVDIVIVEDNPSDAELMIRSLKKNKLANRLILLEDGEEALDFLFTRGKYAGKGLSTGMQTVIFLDLKLPKISGLDVLKQIKSNDITKNLPVVAVTSSKENSDINTAYDIGVNSYVVKPVDYDKFVKMVNQLNLYWLIINENPK